MPEALRADAGLFGLAEGPSPSRAERSRPRDGAPDFLTAVFAPAPFGLEGWEASSSFKRASFSAFFRTASAALSAAAALRCVC